MTEQPQLFTIPAVTLTRIVNFLAEFPFKDVAPILSMIDQTAKPYEEQDNGTSKRPVRQRQRRKPK